MGKKLILRDIGKVLNRSITQLDNGTLDKLRDARRNALQHQLTPKHSPVTVWLSHLGLIHHGSHHSGIFHKSHNLALALLLAMSVSAGVYYWHSSHEHDHSEIDMAILTDDLPVEMYVD